VARLRASGAALVFVGLGCPRQEVFVSEYRDDLSMPLVAVGAAFDYHAGLLIDSPAWVQRAGLQWLHRLLQEPRRLWKRYLLLNPEFLARWALQRSGLRRPDPNNGVPPRSEERYG
jgi:N-acetylglucosaminyldiphosphoundecaprenol N-acetyl-beta-D-mannosaminyltransferase